MKNKVITKEHFEYLDKIVKILGFENLADYQTVLTYETLKESTEDICSDINLTINNFKKLFPLDEFDLRKWKYKFANIDQVIGFVKKLFFYLNVPLEYQNKLMRLIPQNKLYCEYIKMIENRDIPQFYFTPKTHQNFDTPSKHIDEYKSYQEILDEKEYTVCEESYLVTDKIELNASELDLIETIEVSMIEDEDKHTRTYNINVNFNFEQIAHKRVDTFCDTNELFTINLPNFARGPISSLTITGTHDYPNVNSMLKITLVGRKFTTPITTKYIKFDHDTYYFSHIHMKVFDDGRIKNYQFDLPESEVIMFSSLLKYLDKPYTQHYSIKTSLNVTQLQLDATQFAYFNRFMIARDSIYVCPKSKREIHYSLQLKIGTLIQIELGGIVYYNKIINEDDTFDINNYFILDINLPNAYFYKLHHCKLLITSSTDSVYTVSVTGSQIKKSFPQKILNNYIIFDHDKLWYQPNSIVMVSAGGSVVNTVATSNSDMDVTLCETLLHVNKKFSKYDFSYDSIEFNCLQINNTRDDILSDYFALSMLCKITTNTYAGYNAVSVHEWCQLTPSLRKIKGNKIIFYYNMHHCDIVLDLKLLNLENYEYEAYYLQNKIKYSNLIAPINLIKHSQLVIEVNDVDAKVFETISIERKNIFTIHENRKRLAQC